MTVHSLLQLLSVSIVLGTASAQIPDYPDYGRNICEPNPCQNGGSCFNAFFNYVCLCANGFTGSVCEEEEESVDFCSQNPCQNGGRCNSVLEVCYCPTGYIGAHCEENVHDACTDYVCYNGGTCSIQNNTPYCICPDQYTGTYCKSRISDLCENYNCNEGWCYTSASIGGMVARCRCPEGTSGWHCEVTHSCRSNPCQNGGTCLPITDDFVRCHCLSGYSGQHCETQVYDDSCSSNPCLNEGTCVWGYCHCQRQYTGPTCATYVNIACQQYPCSNGGTCIPHDDDEDGYTCNCPDWYTGDHCENEIKVCESNPCQNGGFCHDLENRRYMCTCATGWQGVNCTELASSKEGSCPTSITYDMCNNVCQNDLDCSGLKKCCASAGGCNTPQCTEPDLSGSSLCQRARAEAQAVLSDPYMYGIPYSRDMYIPQCDANGRFEDIQCHQYGNKQQCWCVNQQGIKIPETETDSGKHPYCPNLSDNCPDIECEKACTFGFAVDGNGCSQCECYHPCKNYTCQSDSVCLNIRVECRQQPNTLCQGIPECIDKCFLWMFEWRGIGDYDDDDDEEECYRDEDPWAGHLQLWYFNSIILECYPDYVCQHKTNDMFHTLQACQDSCLNKFIKNINSPLGYPVVLDCSVPTLYNETATVAWYKDGSMIMPPSPYAYPYGDVQWQRDHYTLVNGTNLKIDHVVANDQGSYMCRSHGQVTVTIKYNLTVYDANCSSEIYSCAVDPCYSATCRGYPNARCVPNYCGGCGASFIDVQGNPVTCREDGDICAAGNPLLDTNTGQAVNCDRSSSCPGGYICTKSRNQSEEAVCCPNPKCNDQRCDNDCGAGGAMMDNINCPTCICRDTLLDYIPERCLSPAEVGRPCQNTAQWYWYDYRSATCTMSNCLENDNTFLTQKDCMDTCLGPPKNASVWSGNNVTLECPTHLGSPADVAWYKGTQGIAKGNTVIAHIPGAIKYAVQEWKLTVNDLKMEDEDTYTCEVYVKDGKDSFTVRKLFILKVLIYTGDKPGTCPPIRGSSDTVYLVCVDECRTDAQCSGSRKCCSDGCAMVCQSPVQGCPADKPPRWCSRDLCDSTICRWNHFATCKVNICGECKVKFYNSDGTEADCDTPLSKCHLENLAAINTDSSFTPLCFRNGSYIPKQCNNLETYCWCVDESGAEIPDTRVESTDLTCGKQLSFLRISASRLL
ncbi:fibropellin-1-like [Ptychodera flava]|uniref:fibropellin-1-like n=1 Tax=Ptychodera flava TaxID=63121 RepID=UPI00396A4116